MSEYVTTEDQREQLLNDGFVLLPRALPSELLVRWREIAGQLETDAMNAHNIGDSLHGAAIVEDPVGPRLMRFDDILKQYPDAVLDLLSCPAMMAVARELCGRGSVPLQADIVYKQQHPHPVIIWHQGAPHPRNYPYLNIGIYLDDADSDDGCVRYVPGSQHQLHNIGELSESHGWDIPGVIELPAIAGDIIVQDMMILHGSPPKRSSGVRRTIYVEMRPAAGVLESGAQSEQWLELRKRWMGLVVQRCDKSEWPEEWHEDIPEQLGSDETEIESIFELHEPPIPAVYAPYNVETPEYPVPADMRDN